MKKRRLTPNTAPSIHSARTFFRFWEKVDKRAPDECWPWLGAMSGGGKSQRYPSMRVDGGHAIATRVSWEIENNESLGGRLARHTCDNPACVNPSHIVPGTHQDNMQDAVDRGRMTGMKEKVPGAKLDAGKVATIREQHAAGRSQSAIAREFGISRRAVYGILNGETWADNDARRA